MASAVSLHGHMPTPVEEQPRLPPHLWEDLSNPTLSSYRVAPSVACRVYFACAEKDSQGCQARKIVDRPQVELRDGSTPGDIVTLDGEHNHPPTRVKMS